MVCGFLMLLGALVIIITVLFLSIRDSDMEENEAAPGSSGKGGGGGSNVLVVPQAPAPPPPPVVPGEDTGSSITKETRRPKPPPTTPTPTTPTTSTTTTTPPPPLLCSVGTQTAISKLFPPDNLCDIVIYTHVRVFHKTVIGTVNDISYQAFRNACSTYVDTSCGLSFHVRHLEQDMFQTVEVRDDLSTLKQHHRVYHYGILNIIEDSTHVERLATVIVPAILKVMRKLLGSNRERNKVFVGVGYYFYDERSAWTDLEYTAENLALTEVDIVVILTTVLTMPSPARCLTLPVNVYKSRDSHPATLDKAYRMATSQFSRPVLVVALALQMGVAVYSMNESHSSANSALYKPCTGFGLSDYSQLVSDGHGFIAYSSSLLGMRFLTSSWPRWRAEKTIHVSMLLDTGELSKLAEVTAHTEVSQQASMVGKRDVSSVKRFRSVSNDEAKACAENLYEQLHVRRHYHAGASASTRIENEEPAEGRRNSTEREPNLGNNIFLGE
ncbi:uncharacterized protein [Dermacentor andersoni]|uniref:uncharacterized protein n=1 Tax=Dermacentor andersoni TaxID=34620 RepID=UPI003B3ABBDC